jgi:hypothetical protein
MQCLLEISGNQRRLNALDDLFYVAQILLFTGAIPAIHRKF